MGKNIIRNSYEISSLTGDAMTAAESAIIWVQSTYDLNIPKMAKGELISNHMESPRSVDKSHLSESLFFEDLFQISHTAVRIGLFAVAIKFYLASLISHQENNCLLTTTDKICRSYKFDSIETWYLSKHDNSLLNQSSNLNFDSAERFPFRITKDLISDKEKTHSLLNADHGKMKRVKLVKDGIYDLSDKERFRLVCRGVIKNHVAKKQPEHKSVFVNRNDPFLNLGPFKIQILSEVPIKLIVVDIFSDRETSWLYSTSMKAFDDESKKVYPTSYENINITQQSHSAVLGTPDAVTREWEKENKMQLLSTYDRITLATGLYTRPPYASEILRVATYAVAGTLIPHYDSFGEGELDPERRDLTNRVGDRIATFMGWLSDTDEGGATCFTSNFLEGTVLPRRGSGLFWINNKRSFERDDRLKHGGCPVLRGSKEVLNNWIFSYEQWKTWTCGIDSSSEFNVYEDFLLSKANMLGYKRLANYIIPP